MNNRYIIALLCAGALAFACGPRSGDKPIALASVLSLPLHANAASSTTTPAGPATARPRRVDSSKPAKLDAKLDVNVTPREVHLALRVTNVGGKHAELIFPSGKSYDFAVVDSTGREVWRWAKGRMFTQGVQNKQLSAGDAMRVSETWSTEAKPGRYTAIATLHSSNFPVEERADFVIP